MPRADSYPTHLLGASKAHDYRGKPEEAPDAGYAKKCACEKPWVERDEDGCAHCVACGRDV